MYNAFCEAADYLGGVHFDDIEPFQFARYGKGQSYEWHVDSDHREEPTRKLTGVVALNKGFSGGGLQFLWPTLATQVQVEMEPGDLCVFLSTLHHRGAEVYRGKRYVLVAWATGRPWK